MDLEKIKMLCYACPNAYNCKYFGNVLWRYWMLSNNTVCPATLYTYDSILYACIEQQKKKKEKERYNHINHS